MRELIYYPTFEVQSLDWLKFALLYLDKLNPIIPTSGDKYLSDLTWKLVDETDLIDIHRPEYEEGEKATLDAIEVVEKILLRPQAYSRIFRNNNIIDLWTHSENHNYSLFREKYTDLWERFCLERSLATKIDIGLCVPKELGAIYMTLLAQIIADARGISPITDNPHLDRFSIFTRRPISIKNNNLKIARTVLQFQLPENLSQISLEKVISFRKRKGFKERLGAFHKELDTFYDAIENGKSPEVFVKSLNKIWQEFTGDIVKLGLGAMSFGLGAWILVNSPQVTTEAYLKEIVIGGALLVCDSLTDIRSTWKNTQTKRYTRKYLADISRLKSA